MAEKISLFINGKQFEFWESVNINLSLDSIDTFSFPVPFDADNKEFRERFQPFTYFPCEIRLNDDPLIVGRLIGRNAGLSGKTLSLGGYSAPGVLNDLPIPPDKYPIEFKEQDLRWIAATLAGYYDIQTEYSAPIGAPFSPSVSPEPGEKILDFLIKLAKKRSLLASNTLDGKLNFFIPGKSSNITPLVQGEIPLIDVQIDFNEQEMFSSVTGFGAAQFGREPESFTIPIPALENVNRPFIYTVSDALGAELEGAVRFKAGRIFANSIPLSANVEGWRAADGKIWSPGNFISLRAPNIFFYNETKLLIRGVQLKRDGSNEDATLKLVFPGTYSGILPKKMPWK